MRAPRVERAAAAAAIVTAMALGVTGCIPSPPPLPASPGSGAQGSGGQGGGTQGDGGTGAQAPAVDAAAGELHEGRVERGGTAEVELVVAERSAVVVGATSLDGKDLTLRLTGDGVDVAVDDSRGDPDGFAFELGSRDPALGAVLEPGTYVLEVEEFRGDPAAFELQVLMSATTVAPGETASVRVAAGAPAVVIVPAGSEAIAASSPIDTVLWAHASQSDQVLGDDDSGGDRDPRIDVPAIAAGEDLAVVLTAYDRDEPGSAQLSVE